MTTSKTALELIQERLDEARRRAPDLLLQPESDAVKASRNVISPGTISEEAKKRQQLSDEQAEAWTRSFRANPEEGGAAAIKAVRGDDRAIAIRALEDIRAQEQNACLNVEEAERELVELRERAAAWGKLLDQAHEVAETWPDCESGFLRE